MINKEVLTRVVDEYYPSTYKIFTINSEDGISTCSAKGLFISLGITTTLSSMRELSNNINKRLGVATTISEVESRYSNGGYINKVSRVDVDSQYNSGALNNGDILDYSGINDLINDLKDKLINNSNDQRKFFDYSCRVAKVSRILKRMNSLGSPNNYCIRVVNTDDEFDLAIINRKINYIQITEDYNNSEIIVHKRIGILIKF